MYRYSAPNKYNVSPSSVAAPPAVTIRFLIDVSTMTTPSSVAVVVLPSEQIAPLSMHTTNLESGTSYRSRDAFDTSRRSGRTIARTESCGLRIGMRQA